uniref:Interleukin 9 receptor n=1 Tax=Panthera leo TaxID=9689 RepID=A0A8C8Y657_PANLE
MYLSELQFLMGAAQAVVSNPSYSIGSGPHGEGVLSAQFLAGWTLETEALMRELSTWLLICTCISPWVGLGVSIHGEGGGLGAGSFICLNNNILRIDCHWSAVELGQGPSPWLLFTRGQGPVVRMGPHDSSSRGWAGAVAPWWRHIPFPATTPWAAITDVSSGPASALWCCHLRRCLCLLTTSPSLSTVTSLGRSRSAWWTHSTCPGDMSNVSSDYCVLTWSVSPALEPLISMLSYELAFKRQGETWEQAQHRDHIFGVTWLRLEAIELDPGSSYEARLRVQMASPEDDLAEEQHYAGQWSDWSQPVCFPSPQTSARGPLLSPRGQPDGTLVAVPVFLLLTSLTCLLFKLSPRSVAKVCVCVCVCVCARTCVCMNVFM